MYDLLDIYNRLKWLYKMRTIKHLAKEQLEIMAEKQGMNLTQLKLDLGKHKSDKVDFLVYYKFIKEYYYKMHNLLDKDTIIEILGISIGRLNTALRK